MVRGRDIWRARHIFWLLAVYAGEHGDLKTPCHVDETRMLRLRDVVFAWQMRHVLDVISSLAVTRPVFTFYKCRSIRTDRCHVECSRCSAPGRRQWWRHQARCAAIADRAEARVAVFPLALCFGDAGAVAGDEVPPHLERCCVGFAAEQQGFAAGGQLELQVVAAGFEVEEFVAAERFAGCVDLPE